MDNVKAVLVLGAVGLVGALLLLVDVVDIQGKVKSSTASSATTYGNRRILWKFLRNHPRRRVGPHGVIVAGRVNLLLQLDYVVEFDTFDGTTKWESGISRS